MIKFIREYMAGIGNEYVMEGKREPCKAFLLLLFIRYFSRELLSRAICATVGHQWLDRSYGGPDHGYFDIECARCGCGVHKNLY